MLKYKDSADREWSLKLSIDVVDRIKAATDIDLLGKPKDVQDAYAKIMEDVRVLMNVCWHIVEPQAAAAGVSIDAFRQAIDGDTIERMAETLTEAIADFSPTHLRTLFRKGWEKGKQMDDRQLSGALAAMEETDLEKLEAKAKQKTSAAISKMLERSDNSSGS